MGRPRSELYAGNYRAAETFLNSFGIRPGSFHGAMPFIVRESELLLSLKLQGVTKRLRKTTACKMNGEIKEDYEESGDVSEGGV